MKIPNSAQGARPTHLVVSPLVEQSFFGLLHSSLPRITRIPRRDSVLLPGPLAEQEDVLSLHLGAGCPRIGSFSPAQSGPEDEVVRLHANTASDLDRELCHRLRRPRSVLVSPRTDPFPPLAEFQAETARVVELLAKHGVEAWLMTRGYIRPAVLDVLATHRQFVKVTIGLTTLDRALQRVLEPLAASPQLRLRQVRRLRERGIRVQVALEPLVPGLTDTRDNLAGLLQALTGLGVQRVTAGYFSIPLRTEDNLAAALQPHGWDRLVLDAYAGGPVLGGRPVLSARYLPKARRQRGYAVLMSLAAERGITVGIGAISNPDFRTPTRPVETGPRQRLLPHFDAGNRLALTRPQALKG